MPFNPTRGGRQAAGGEKAMGDLVSDPEHRLPKDDFVGWVLQIPEDESPATTQDRIFRSVYDFNTTKRGRMLPVNTIGEALENVPAKQFKEADLWPKTRLRSSFSGPTIGSRKNDLITAKAPREAPRRKGERSRSNDR